MDVTCLLAQTTQPYQPVQPRQALNNSVDYMERLFAQLINFLPTLLAAVAILLVGLLIAAVVSGVVRGILNRTNVDNRIAAAILGRTDQRDLPKVEKVISNFVFWVIVLITAVAVRDYWHNCLHINIDSVCDCSTKRFKNRSYFCASNCHAATNP